MCRLRIISCTSYSLYPLNVTPSGISSGSTIRSSSTTKLNFLLRLEKPALFSPSMYFFSSRFRVLGLIFGLPFNFLAALSCSSRLLTFSSSLAVVCCCFSIVCCCFSIVCCCFSIVCCCFSIICCCSATRFSNQFTRGVSSPVGNFYRELFKCHSAIKADRQDLWQPAPLRGALWDRHYFAIAITSRSPLLLDRPDFSIAIPSRSLFLLDRHYFSIAIPSRSPLLLDRHYFSIAITSRSP